MGRREEIGTDHGDERGREELGDERGRREGEK